MSILIGGGTGFIGRNLVRQLVKSNHEVIIVTRNPKKKSEIAWRQIESSGIPKGVKTVVNLAGQQVATPFGHLRKSFMKECYDSRVGTNRILAKAIRNMESPPELFLSMSGVGYYPPSESAVYDENGPNGSDWLGRLAREWELATTLPEALPVRRAIIRSGVVLGPDGGMMREFKRLVFPLVFTLPFFGNGKQFFPWIHIADMVRIIELVIENKQMKGTFNGVAPQVIDYKTFTDTFGEACYEPLTTNYYKSPSITAGSAKFLFGKDIAVMLLEGQNVNSLRLKRAGFSYQFPTIDEAFSDIISTWTK